MTDFLLDTNHAARLLAGDPRIMERVRGHRQEGHRFGVSMTVLGELHFAVHASQRRSQNEAALRVFLESVIIWDFDREAAEEFGKIQAEQKRMGRPIPASDAQIAAVARLNDLTILSADGHFKQVTELAVENWL